MAKIHEFETTETALQFANYELGLIAEKADNLASLLLVVIDKLDNHDNEDMNQIGSALKPILLSLTDITEDAMNSFAVEQSGESN